MGDFSPKNREELIQLIGQVLDHSPTMAGATGWALRKAHEVLESLEAEGLAVVPTDATPMMACRAGEDVDQQHGDSRWVMAEDVVDGLHMGKLVNKAIAANPFRKSE